MILNGKNVREIHKKIYEITIKVPKMYLFMSKVADKSIKKVNRNKKTSENADFLLIFFMKSHFNEGIKKIINKNLTDEAEKQKNALLDDYIQQSEDENKWLYLASSHTDCAKDHLPWQGKIYYDENAPSQIKKFAKRHGYKSIQWVMDAPVYFITRPNCRHFFKSLLLDVVKQYNIKELQRRYKTHKIVGDRSLATPRKITIEEYQDRLKMFKAMYREYPNENLKIKIQKTEILLKKHLNQL